MKLIINLLLILTLASVMMTTVIVADAPIPNCLPCPDESGPVR